MQGHFGGQPPTATPGRLTVGLGSPGDMGRDAPSAGGPELAVSPAGMQPGLCQLGLF